MATDKDFVNRSISTLTHMYTIYTGELEAIVSNIRWLTTLVLAEIAGLAGYRELRGEKTLSIGFAFVILILSISLFIFLVTVIMARYELRKSGVALEQGLSGVNREDQRCSNDDNIAPREARERISPVVDGLIHQFISLTKLPKLTELLGILFFVLGSLIAAIATFFSELLALFSLG
jgi:hypothetical protein